MADSDTITIDRSVLAQALELHTELQRKLEEYGHRGDEESAASAIDTVRQGMADLRGFYERNLGITQPAEHIGERAPQQVFDLPELVEQILIHLNAYDLLLAQQINGTTAAIWRSSKSIREIMCLKPDPESFWRTPFTPHAFPSIYVNHNDKPFSVYSADADDYVAGIDRSFTITFKATKDLLKVGSLGREMLLCQPPVCTMTAEVGCCSWARRSQAAAVEGLMMMRRRSRVAAVFPPSPDVPPSTSATGLRVGDLLDAAGKLREEHRLCPYAMVHDHDEQGLVKPSVTFSGSVTLRADDAVVKARHQSTVSTARRG